MKLFSKLKDYNEILEAVLDKKYFSSNIKNLWLNMIYKLEIAYPDYIEIKRTVRNKDDFLEEIIDTIKNYCEHIQVVEPETKEAEILKKHKVYALTNDRERSILSYPTEIAFLYAVSDIIPKYFFIENNYIFKNLLQNMLVEGFNYNNVSILLDFNGWSWDNSPKENTPFISNLIYQNILCIFGEKFLYDWRNSSSTRISYLEEFQYSIENLDKRNKYLLEIQKLLYRNASKEEVEKLEPALLEKKEELAKMNNREKYLLDVKNKKRECTNRVQEIDYILNDDDLLIKEFEDFNNKLEDDKKITNIKTFRNMIIRERKECAQKIKDLNDLQNPILYLKRKEALEEIFEVYSNNERLETLITKSQLEFLKLFEKKLNQFTTNSEIIDIIYELRYYKKINISPNKKIEDISKINNAVDAILKKAVTKACKIGILKIISMDIALNFNIIKIALNTNIIELKEINLSFNINKEGKLLVRVFDKDVYEKEEIIDLPNGKKDLEVKQRKMIKLFI